MATSKILNLGFHPRLSNNAGASRQKAFKTQKHWEVEDSKTKTMQKIFKGYWSVKLKRLILSVVMILVFIYKSTCNTDTSSTGPKNTEKLQDICLVAGWKGDLAPYHKLMLKTANHHKNLIFMHENQDLSAYPNINSFNVKNMDEFMAREVCEFFGVYDCQVVVEAFKNAENNVFGSALAQYRILFSIVINKYYNCKSWAFVDHDVILGNVDSFVSGNDDFWKSNLVGFGQQIYDGMFMTGQFTAMVGHKHWFLSCKLVKDLNTLVDTFNGNHNFYAMDEGCLFKGSMEDGATITIFPYQASDWENEFLIWDHGEVYAIPEGYPELYSISQNEVLLEDSNHLIPWNGKTDCTSWIVTEFRTCMTLPTSTIYDMPLSVYQIRDEQMFMVKGMKLDQFRSKVALAHIASIKHNLDFENFKSDRDVFVIRVNDSKVFSFDRIGDALDWLTALSTL